MNSCVFDVVALVCLSIGAPVAPIKGPFKVTHKTFTYLRMDSTDRQIDVWWPSPTSEQKTFPLISYAHGDSGGGASLLPGYETLLHSMSAFGYVIAAVRACNTGCHDDRTSLPFDPPGFGHYYYQQLRVFNWTKNETGTPFNLIDWSNGVGVAGHSMGGQATLYSSGSGNPKLYNIAAGVMHHPYTHSYPHPEVPFIVFTGKNDKIAPAHPMAVNIYNAKGAFSSRGLVNKENANHFEPNPMAYNNLLPQFSVAWFKIYLDKTPTAYGINFHDLIFGTGATSVCKGGDGAMAECEVKP